MEVGKTMKRWAIGVCGGIVLIVGIIAIPYPGPGWLIVFTGLAILSTEFAWAKRLLHFARGKYDAWQAWLLRQGWAVRLGFMILTALVVVVTLWLLDVYGQLNDWLNLGVGDWVYSPIFK